MPGQVSLPAYPPMGRQRPRDQPGLDRPRVGPEEAKTWPGFCQQVHTCRGRALFQVPLWPSCPNATCRLYLPSTAACPGLLAPHPQHPALQVQSAPLDGPSQGSDLHSAVHSP